MITTLHEPPPTYMLLYNVPWRTYEALADELEGRHLRITYDQGTLEIMAKSYEHEFDVELLGRIVHMTTFELRIPLRSGGSTTFRDEDLDRGLEPDKCFWIQNEKRMRGKRKFVINRDPPPDLALEIEVTRSALDRMGIYAALEIPEVWRWDGKSLHIHHLAANGKYRVKLQSRAFPFLPITKLLSFLKQAESADETAVMHAFVDWLRAVVEPLYRKQTGKTEGNGQRHGK